MECFVIERDHSPLPLLRRGVEIAAVAAARDDPEVLGLPGLGQLLLGTGFFRFQFPIDEQEGPGADAADDGDGADVAPVTG